MKRRSRARSFTTLVRRAKNAERFNNYCEQAADTRLVKSVIAVAGAHVAGGHCWCRPEIQYTDPVTGVSVWVHKDDLQ